MQKAITAVLFVGLVAGMLMADPMAPVSVTGDASFQQDGNNWAITTATDKTIINWSGFGVAQGATVHFQQPGSGSAVLNRVLGSQASYINGMLTSNGSVYLLNPHGVVIGPGGVVSVASFIATTLSVPDSEFLAGGDMNFTGASLASIENYGKIDAIGGDIYLIATNVVNAGSLTASAGSANLVAGTDILLTQDNDIFVRPSLLIGSGIGVDNSGVIDAIVARLQADGNMYALAINNTGVLRATGPMATGGRILLRAEGGSVVNAGTLAARSVNADGATAGGEIYVLGDEVTITGGATIDASGDTGGGRILIGGDLGGANPSVLNAKNTRIDSGAVVAADALATGDGGTVIVWSDGATTAGGTISARGAAGGNGGFVETSGHILDIGGLDLSCGAGGTWLIDPPGWTIGPVQAAAIGTQLTGGTSVLVPSVGGILNVAADITATPVGAPILLLKATGGGSIAVNANIDIGNGDLRLWAESGVTQAAGTTLAAAFLQIKGSGVFNLNQPGNDFGTVGVMVDGASSYVSIQDVNDLAIGNVGSAHGASVNGGEIHITTPNGYIYCNGLFPVDIIQGYHALGNVAIAETSWNSQSYELLVSNDPPARSPAEVESFLGLPVGSLNSLDPNTYEGSAVRIQFVDLAGDTMGYGWNFRVRETYAGQSPNDYSFVVVDPGGLNPPQPELLADVELARTAAKQDSGQFSWQTGWGRDDRTLNHTDPYTLSLGVMDVVNPDHLSRLQIRDITFTGHLRTGFFFVRIFDHVEDFPHIRPDERVGSVAGGLMDPALDEVSTYFDESSRGTEPKHFYQSVGSIYQIPR